MIKAFFRFRLLICASVLSALTLTGCGKGSSDGLATYKEEMTQFYDKLSYYDTSINAIEADSENAKVQLLGYLDEMNETYKSMAACEIPDEFSGISDIAAEAADYMQMANECYHFAYDGAFDEENEQLAFQYYQRANSRAQVMLQVLHGEVPSGDGVTVTTQEAGQFDTIGEAEDN
ncbi:hypothetical protein [Butyrivibrio sp. YAB3001]|uniref:hypothetical protein n=1 Tax=Butyrivibrio sp. YAB3001 TaxID=1520812 RepID=UPI0008F643C7|nr:hypothetical protein [Butyrivibrio sp. YAB3001]SFB70012.1 hypothetical protein SAMN02910398_00316 [Butyrivibrio sp. YAB3001]